MQQLWWQEEDILLTHMYSNEEVKKRYVGKIIFAPCSFQLKFTKMKHKDITIMKFEHNVTTMHQCVLHLRIRL